MDEKNNAVFPDVIYLESQPLRESLWPNVSHRLKSLVVAAKLRRIPVRLPLAVIQELEGQYVRNVQALAQPIGRIVKPIYVPGEEDLIRWPTITDLRSRYHQLVEDRIAELGIEVVPMPTRRVEEFLGDAIGAVAPFRRTKNATDAGFKDAVVYWSIVEDSIRSAATQPVLVSADLDYRPHAEHQILSVGPIDKIIERLTERRPNGGVVRVFGLSTASFELHADAIELVSEGAECGAAALLGPFEPGDPIQAGLAARG